MNKEMSDIVILGGGMVGLTIAHQLLKRGVCTKITIVDKERELGRHSSGRNSGVLHAGLYYKPDSVKAKICVKGARRLKQWVLEQGLPINPCGKIIVPQRYDLDSQLDILAERGRTNGAEVEMWDEKQLKEIIPEARTASGRALWSPGTVVVKPLTVVRRLMQDLKEKGVMFKYNKTNFEVDVNSKKLVFNDETEQNYGYLFNCAGLQADRVAQKFGVGQEYTLLPFKGLYWQIKKNCPIKLKTNLYPVPDLNIPFLGVHFTPNTEDQPIVSIGPTATIAWGRENYRGIKSIEPSMAANNLNLLARQYITDRGGFRRYVHEQAFLNIKPLLVQAAKQLVPKINHEHIEQSEKVGIRSQLYNLRTKRLEDDFICINGPSSTHILNAISPAFTASFALADLIIDKSIPSLNSL